MADFIQRVRRWYSSFLPNWMLCRVRLSTTLRLDFWRSGTIIWFGTDLICEEYGRRCLAFDITFLNVGLKLAVLPQGWRGWPVRWVSSTEMEEAYLQAQEMINEALSKDFEHKLSPPPLKWQPTPFDKEFYNRD